MLRTNTVLLCLCVSGAATGVAAVPGIVGGARPTAGTRAATPAAGALQGDYELVLDEVPVPEPLAPLAEHFQPQAHSLVDSDGQRILDIWFVAELPASANPPADPSVNYGTIPEGALFGGMQVHVEHHDFRDQPVGPGAYVMRYLQQPADGNHLGETTYRDFAVLTPPAVSRNPAPQGFDVTLGQALTLNTHPLTWGLWPPADLSADELPALVSFDDDKWAMKLRLPRSGGESVEVGLVVVGNERNF